MLKNNKGQSLVIILGISLLIAIMIPTMIFLLHQEAKWTVKQKKTVTAFQIAEAGLDRAVWKMNENATNWRNAAQGTIPHGSGFDGNTTFSDVAGGVYRIKVARVSDTEIAIMAAGRDDDNRELRGLYSIYGTDLLDTSIRTDGNISMSGNFEVHWGPIKTKGNINLSGAAEKRFYPKKYATGNVNPRDTTGSTPPNNCTCSICLSGSYSGPEWTSLATIPDIEIDLDRYKTLAQNYRPPPGSPTGTSGYRESNVTFNNFEDNQTSTATYYIKGNMTLQNSFIRGRIIVEGNAEFGAAGGKTKDNYPIIVPAGASKHYRCNNFGSVGGATDPWTFWTGRGWVENSSTTLNKVALHGFLFATGNLTGTANSTVIGGVAIKGNAEVAGTPVVYYSPTTISPIEYKNLSWQKTIWREFHPQNFTSPNWPY